MNIKNILNTYIDKYYDINVDKDTWFNKMKLLGTDRIKNRINSL